MTKLIKDFTHHTIDTNGVVTNTKTGHCKAQWIGANGYLHVDIQEFGLPKKVALHRLLAIAFIPNPENKRTVNHIDGDKLNNSISNLEWATDSENIKHAYDNDLNHCSTKKINTTDYDEILPRFFNGESLTKIVEDYNFSLPTLSTYIEDYVKSIGMYDKFLLEKARQKALRAKSSKRTEFTITGTSITDGTMISFKSLSEAARQLNKSSSGPISNALSGRAKSAYGYTWVRS